MAYRAANGNTRDTPSPLLPRGLFPRHLRATFASFFVHLPIRGQAAQLQGGKGLNNIKKIVQNCALLCSCNPFKSKSLNQLTKSAINETISAIKATINDKKPANKAPVLTIL